MAFRGDSVNLNLPFGLGSMTIQRTEAQMRCAWALGRLAGVAAEE